jgi:NTE family protein
MTTTEPSGTREAAGTDEARPRFAVLGLVMAVGAMAIMPLAVTGTNLAFPAISESFDSVARSTLSWTISGYSIVMAAFTLLGGQLSDRYGSHRVFTVGVAVFMAASAASALAPNAGVLIAARALQGSGGAMIVPASLGVALARWPKHKRATAIGVWTSAFPIGSSVGPVLSALVLDLGGWRLLFGLPAILLAIVLATAVALGDGSPDVRSGETGLPDIVGIVTGTVAVALLALGITKGPSWGWTSPSIIGCMVGAFALAPLFVRRCRRHPRPLLPLGLFRIRTFRVAIIANVFVGASGMSAWLVWPLLFSEAWDWEPLQIGLAISPTPLTGAFMAVFVTRWAERRGYRGLLSLGAVSLILANIWFFVFRSAEPDYWFSMLPGLLLFGIGMGFTFAPLNAASLVDVPAATFSKANAVFNTDRSLAGALGIAAVIAAIGNGGDTDPMAPFGRAYVVLGVFAVISLAIFLLAWPRRSEASSG